ncbi:unnamed protein product [Absidia cylindrospora]
MPCTELDAQSELLLSRSIPEEVLSSVRIQALYDDPSFDIEIGNGLSLPDFALLQAIVGRYVKNKTKTNSESHLWNLV